jgi:hypothetical protein
MLKKNSKQPSDIFTIVVVGIKYKSFSDSLVSAKYSGEMKSKYVMKIVFIQT